MITVLTSLRHAGVTVHQYDSRLVQAVLPGIATVLSTAAGIELGGWELDCSPVLSTVRRT